MLMYKKQTQHQHQIWMKPFHMMTLILTIQMQLLSMIVNLIVNMAVIMDIKFIFNIQNVKYNNFIM